MNKPDQNEQEFLKAVKTNLDNAEQSLDEVTLQRLHGARSRALESLTIGNHQSEPKWSQWLMPASALATTAVITMLVINLSTVMPDVAQDKSMLSALEDIEILADEDELELYQELEFYQWLASKNELG